VTKGSNKFLHSFSDNYANRAYMFPTHSVSKCGNRFTFSLTSLYTTRRFFFRGFLLHIRTKAAKASASSSELDIFQVQTGACLSVLYRVVEKGFCACLYKTIDHASLSSLQLCVQPPLASESFKLQFNGDDRTARPAVKRTPTCRRGSCKGNCTSLICRSEQ
jgi:hypothetical protein